MERERIVRAIEHSLLTASATESDVLVLCREAMEHGFYSVCINPIHIAAARRALAGSGVRITTVIGFPLGASHYGVKAYEAMQAVLSGADELDMVMDIGAAREGRWEQVCRDIRSVVMASPEAVHKVIIEACYLTDEQKRLAALAAVESGAEYVKTSTGFGPGGATVEDVRLILETLKGRARIKAAGGIKTLGQAVEMIEAGADLIGTSSGVAILAELG
jgi:deoxyribose-phosphate aldolase